MDMFFIFLDTIGKEKDKSPHFYHWYFLAKEKIYHVFMNQ